MGRKEFFRRAQGGEGLQTIVPTDDPDKDYVNIDLLRATDGERFEFGEVERELGIVVLGGNCLVS
jgi:5-deoxy-D-glucuronate isomerase